MFAYKNSVSRIALAAVAVSIPLKVTLAADVIVQTGESIVVGNGVDPIEVVGPDQLTVEQGGSVEGSAETPVYVSGTGSVIDNSGKIFTADGQESALYVSAAGTGIDIDITNKAGGEISSVGQSTLLGKNTGSGSVTLDNYGSIIAHTAEGESSSGKAVDFHDFKGTSAGALLYVTVNNYEGGLIEAEGHDAMRLGKDNIVAVVNNWGTIIASGGEGDGIDLQDKAANGSRTINNYASGLIEGDQHGIHGKVNASILNEGRIVGQLGSGINIDGPGDNISVINKGTISGGMTAGGDGDGIDVDRRLLLENYGRVEGLNGYSAEGLAIGGGIINNYAGAEIYGEGRGILADDSDEGPAPYATTVYNEGVIAAGTFDAIKFIGTQSDTIINKGTIRAGESGVAIDMGGGDDTLTIYQGSKIEGIADGGAGFNSINLEGTGKDTLGSNFYRFSRVNVNSGAWSTLLAGSDYQVFEGATLITDSDIAEPNSVSVEGGRLEARGEISELYFNGGTLAVAGGDIGHLTVTGSLGFNTNFVFNEDYSQLLDVKDPVLEVTVAADGRSDLLTVASSSGSATLSLYNDTYDGFDFGPKLKVEALAGDYAAETTYHIVHVDGTIDGQFLPENVAVNFAFLDASLEYDPSDIFLTLSRNDTEFWDVAETRNQSNVAKAIAAAGGSDLHNEIVTMDVEEAQNAFDTLSGEGYASSMSGQIVQAGLINDTIQGHAGSVFGSTGGPAQPPAFAQPQYLGARAPKSEAKSQATNAPSRYTAGWAKGFGQWLSMDGDSNAAALDSTVGGVVAGYDVVSRNSMFGLAAGYTQASADVDARLSSIDTDTFVVAAYGAVRIDNNLKLSAGANYAWSWSDSERVALGDKLTASYDGNTASVFGEVAYLTRMGRAAFEPFAGIAYVNVDEDSFAETGGIGALTSDGQSFDNVSSTIGMRFAFEAIGAEGARITPRASLAWRHAFGELTPEAALRFADTGTAFTVSGTPIGRDSVVIGAGFDIDLAENVTVGLDYTGAFADAATTNAARAVGRIGF